MMLVWYDETRRGNAPPVPRSSSRVSAVGVVGHVIEGDVEPFEIIGRDVWKVPLSVASYQ